MAVRPPGTLVGRLRVKVLPDTSDFEEELYRDLKRARDEAQAKLEDITVGVRLNEADVKAAQARLADAFDNQTVLITPVVTPGAGGAGGGDGTTPPTPPVTPPGGGGGGDDDGIDLADLKKRSQAVGALQREIEAVFARLGGAVAQGGAILAVAALIAASMSAIVGGVILLPGLLFAVLAPVLTIALGFDGVKSALSQVNGEIKGIPAALDTINFDSFMLLTDALNGASSTISSGFIQVGLAVRPIIQEIADFITRIEGNGQLAEFFDLTAAAVESLAPLMGTLLDLFFQFLLFILPYIPPFVAALVAGLQAMGASFEELGPLIGVAISDFTSLFVGIVEALPFVIAAIIIFGQNARLVFELVGSIIRTVVSAVLITFATLRAGLSEVQGAFQRAGGGIQGIMAALQAIIVTVISAIIAFFGTLATGVAAAVAVVIGVLEKFGLVPAGLADKFREGIDNVRDDFEDLPGAIIGYLDGLPGQLLSLGGDIIGGLRDGISSGIAGIKSDLQSLTASIPEWKGPPERDKHLLEPAADDIMGGFTDRLRARFADVRATLGDTPLDLETGGTLAGQGGVTQQFYVDPRADEGFVEATATTAYRAANRALNLRYARV